MVSASLNTWKPVSISPTSSADPSAPPSNSTVVGVARVANVVFDNEPALVKSTS